MPALWQLPTRPRQGHLDLLALDRVRATGVFTHAEANKHGLTRHDLGRLLRDNALARVAPGTFVLAERRHQADPRQRHVLRALAATIQLRAPVVLSHDAAAALHGLPLLSMAPSSPTAKAGRPRIHLTRTDLGPSQTLARSTVHRRYGPLQCASPVAGVPALLPVLAAFGVAEVSGMVAGVVALDAALHQKLTTQETARSWLDRLALRPGTAVIRRVIEAADGLSGSPLETQARLIVTALGYRMRLQVPLRSADGEFVARVDGLIEKMGVVIEVDGRGKYAGDGGHGSVEAVLSEKRRESAIRDLGYGIVRVDYAGLDEPPQLDTRIQDAARRAATSRGDGQGALTTGARKPSAVRASGRQGIRGSTAARARSTRSGASCGSHTIRGSAPNHASCRRANRRVANTVASCASCALSSPSRWASAWA